MQEGKRSSLFLHFFSGEAPFPRRLYWHLLVVIMT